MCSRAGVRVGVMVYYCMHAYGLCWIGLGGGDRAPLATISPLIEEREQLDEDGMPFADHDAGSISRPGDDLANVEPTTGLFYAPFVITPQTKVARHYFFLLV